MNKVVVGLGSNINPDENINEARRILKERFEVLAESSFIKTKPVGYTEQDDFLNGAVYLQTEQSMDLLKETLESIEDELGRDRSGIKFGPRTIDLDIIVFNEQVVDDDFYTRDFLKNSVLEILPDLNPVKS